MLAQDSQPLDNIPTRFKQLIHSVDINKNDLVTTFNTVIPSVAKYLKKIHISLTIFNELNSTYYNNKNYGFAMLFKQFKVNYYENNYQPSLIQ